MSKFKITTVSVLKTDLEFIKDWNISLSLFLRDAIKKRRGELKDAIHKKEAIDN